MVVWCVVGVAVVVIMMLCVLVWFVVVVLWLCWVCISWIDSTGGGVVGAC